MVFALFLPNEQLVIFRITILPLEESAYKSLRTLPIVSYPVYLMNLIKELRIAQFLSASHSVCKLF